MLDREEYVEQGFFFRALGERLGEKSAMQELLASVKEEILATTKLPMAIDYMLAELKHSGTFGPAMRRMAHYFTSFQSYLVEEAEQERGRFDMQVALEILRREAEYRSETPTAQGMFFYQFESICRNRLSYDRGLHAIAHDPLYTAQWKEWILGFRHRVGMAEVADLIFVRSEHYLKSRANRYAEDESKEPQEPPLFGEREGRIALANRRKDPMYLFQALHRQLGYPQVPRLEPVDLTPELLPSLARRMERLEARLKLLEEESRGGIDITKFYQPPQGGS